MAIFIIAPEFDAHADWIEWGLRKSAVEVIRWCGLGWQRENSASITLGIRDGVHLADRRIDANDTVWLRRPWLTTHPGVAADEDKFACAEYQAFSNTLLMNIEWTGAFCINKWCAAKSIENKSVQLFLARQCGLLIPTTVMTNASPLVDELQATITGDVVHKTYLPHSWIDSASGMTCGCQTTPLSRGHKFSSEAFAYAPGIYQQKIEKDYDVRITMIGRDLHAFAVRSVDSALDWRLGSMLGTVSVKRIGLPGDVESGLRRFADRAGIVFGCFDMAVDADGNWWFLEVNQAGQFLWIDRLQPDDGLYQPMLKFLSAREISQPKTFPSYRQCRRECRRKDHSVPAKELRWVTVTS